MYGFTNVTIRNIKVLLIDDKHLYRLKNIFSIFPLYTLYILYI